MVAKLGVGSANNRHRLKIIDGVQTKIEHVDADVVERAAASDLLIPKPGAELRNTGSALPPGFCVVDLPEQPLINQLLDLLRICREALVHSNVEDKPRFLRHSNSLRRFHRIHRERLFENNVLTRPQRLNGEGDMKFIGDGDINCINRFIREEFLDCLMREFQRMFFLQNCPSLQVRILNGDEFCVRMTENSVSSVMSNLPCTDEAESNVG